MSKRYYTPEIEEFHKGFIHWLHYKGIDSWEVKIFKGNFKAVERNLNDGRIRVKHLDREDIESLGFELHAENKTGYAGQYFWIKEAEMKGTSRASVEEIHLIFQPLTNWVLIWQTMRLNIGDQENVRFSGKLKNKSELKRILKQIGV